MGKYNVKGASRVGSKTESLEEVVKIRKRKQETGRRICGVKKWKVKESGVGLGNQWEKLLGVQGM